MKKRFIYWCVIGLFVVCILPNLPKLIATYYLDYLDHKTELPSDGTYYCKDISVTIAFDDDCITFFYPDNSAENMDVDFYGRMIGQKSDVIVHYDWECDCDRIEVHVERGNVALIKDRTYCFTLSSES